MLAHCRVGRPSDPWVAALAFTGAVRNSRGLSCDTTYTCLLASHTFPIAHQTLLLWSFPGDPRPPGTWPTVEPGVPKPDTPELPQVPISLAVRNVHSK